MKRLWELFLKYREMIAYLFFGAVTMAINIAVYGIMTYLGCSTGVANAMAWLLSMLAAYFCNRLWVFRSSSKGSEAVKEFTSFVACRLGTGIMDEVLMILGVDFFGPMFVEPAHMGLWGLIMKVFVNILVIILNYVFSKLLIFKKNK